jgi:hypothetical protein
MASAEECALVGTLYMPFVCESCEEERRREKKRRRGLVKRITALCMA